MSTKTKSHAKLTSYLCSLICCPKTKTFRADGEIMMSRSRLYSLHGIRELSFTRLVLYNVLHSVQHITLQRKELYLFTNDKGS